MANFLAVAKAWGGYNPKGQPISAPTYYKEASEERSER